MATIPSMDLLVEFMKHNTMMNERLLEACRPLTAEQLDATVEGTYGTIGATLGHMANGQTGYAARLLDVERPEGLVQNPFPGFDVVAERFARGNAQLEEAAAKGDQDRRVRVTGDDPPGEWWMDVSLFMLQAVNHGHEHRSQVATILTQLGITPPEMDGWTYFFDSGKMVQPSIS